MVTEPFRFKLRRETFERLKHYKGSKTWDGLFELWLDHFDGVSGGEDEPKYVTNREWNELRKRLEQVELEASKGSSKV